MKLPYFIVIVCSMLTQTSFAGTPGRPEKAGFRLSHCPKLESILEKPEIHFQPPVAALPDVFQIRFDPHTQNPANPSINFQPQKERDYFLGAILGCTIGFGIGIIVAQMATVPSFGGGSRNLYPLEKRFVILGSGAVCAFILGSIGIPTQQKI